MKDVQRRLPFLAMVATASLIAGLAVSGCVGGLAFRWLHGERPIG